MQRFLDTNVLLRYFTAGDPDKAQRAKRLLERVERGEEKLVTTTLVVFETVFTLGRTYKVPKEQIRAMVGDVLSLPGVQLAGKSRCLTALDLYAEKSISFVDAYNAVYMQSRGLSELSSWDTDFDKIDGLVPLEPNQPPSAHAEWQPSTGPADRTRMTIAGMSLLAMKNTQTVSLERSP